MTRRLGPTPADDIGADLEPVWDRLASHAGEAPAASPELTARVQGALLSEFDGALRPTVRRPRFVVPPLFRTSSLRSLLAAAALVALLGAGVVLAGAGVARLNQVPVDQPTPVVEEPSDEPSGDAPDAPGPIVQPPARPGPDGIDDPDEDDDDADEDADDTDDEDAAHDDGAETGEPEDEGRPDADEDDEPEDDEPSDSPEEDETPEPENPD